MMEPQALVEVEMVENMVEVEEVIAPVIMEVMDLKVVVVLLELYGVLEERFHLLMLINSHLLKQEIIQLKQQRLVLLSILMILIMEV